MTATANDFGCDFESVALSDPPRRPSLPQYSDYRIQKWVSREAAQVPKAQIVAQAHARIAALLKLPRRWDGGNAPKVAPTAAQVALLLIERHFAFDDSATPQIGPNDEAGLDVEWLVADNHLALTAWPDGTCYLWARRRGDDRPFISVDSAEEPLKFAYAAQESLRFLEDISREVTHRTPIR